MGQWTNPEPYFSWEFIYCLMPILSAFIGDHDNVSGLHASITVQTPSLTAVGRLAIGPTSVNIVNQVNGNRFFCERTLGITTSYTCHDTVGFLHCGPLQQTGFESEKALGSGNLARLSCHFSEAMAFSLLLIHSSLWIMCITQQPCWLSVYFFA